MSDKTPLSGRAGRIEIATGGYTLEAPGWVGQVEDFTGQEHATRSASPVLENRVLEAINRHENTFLVKVFEITVAQDQMPADDATATRSDGLSATMRGSKEAAVVLNVPSLQDDAEYAVLYTDEAGGVRWIYPNDRNEGDSEIRFHLPRNSDAAGVTDAEIAADSPRTRGPLAKLGRRLVRVIAWVTDPIIGAGARALAEKWENKRVPYRISDIVPGEVKDDVTWNHIADGRALLLIHGTFSTVSAGFDGLIHSPAMHALAADYENRVFGFNHPSLHHDPVQNVAEFVRQIPEGLDLEFDMVTHSRGGIVGRVLRNEASLRPNITVGRSVFIAAPNEGTKLADGEFWHDFIDRYTNLLTSLPDNVFTLGLEGLLTLVKLVVRGAIKGLPGLESMLPAGDFLKQLNGRDLPGQEVYAIAAQYEPGPGGGADRFGKIAKGKFVDRVFGEPNDGVVPTGGMSGTNLSTGGFPVPPERLHHIMTDVHHLNYFMQDSVNEQIRTFLTRPPV